jgi:D-amino peptidase
MKVYVSVDMEGLAGVGHPDPTRRDDAGYPAAVDLMVGETNAAVEGALAALAHRTFLAGIRLASLAA